MSLPSSLSLRDSTRFSCSICGDAPADGGGRDESDGGDDGVLARRSGDGRMLCGSASSVVPADGGGRLSGPGGGATLVGVSRRTRGRGGIDEGGGAGGGATLVGVWRRTRGGTADAGDDCTRDGDGDDCAWSDGGGREPTGGAGGRDNGGAESTP